METKRFKIKGVEKAKGGKFLNKQFVAAAGTVTVGAFSAGAGYAVGAGMGKKETEPDRQPTDEATEQQTEAAVAQTETTEPQQAHAAPQQHAADEYQPTDSGQSSVSPEPSQGSEQTVEPGHSSPTEEVVEPNLVAQSIAHEVDEQDIDAENVLTIEQMGTVQGPDGNDIMAVVGHLPDGTQLLLTDIDGDGIFSDVFDMAGNYAGTMDGNLTAGDLIEMYDTTGGHLDVTENIAGDDPTNAITNTEPAHEENSMAQHEEAAEDSPTDEELLAQLTDEIGDDESLLDRVIDELPGKEKEREGLPEENEEAEDDGSVEEQDADDDNEGGIDDDE